jgi:hypothetical protein
MGQIENVKIDLKPWKALSIYTEYKLDATLIATVILECENGDYSYIEEDFYKLLDISKMPYYIKEDWIKYNKKDISIKVINEFIKNINDDSINSPFDNNVTELLELLKSVRRNLIINGVI